MNANLLTVAVVALAAPAFAQFHFDAATGTCVNEAGERGWNVGVRGPCADLSNQQLEGERFSGDLRGARFDGANLKGASFLRADLEKASFVGADLSGAVLTGTRLMGATLDQARMVGAHLDFAQLSGASLAGADVRNACLFRTSFAGADLREATFNKQKALLASATWTRARVLATTLPFDASELSARGLTVSDQLAMAR